jgi:hypothetical protein
VRFSRKFAVDGREEIHRLIEPSALSAQSDLNIFLRINVNFYLTLDLAPESIIHFMTRDESSLCKTL